LKIAIFHVDFTCSGPIYFQRNVHLILKVIVLWRWCHVCNVSHY